MESSERWFNLFTLCNRKVFKMSKLLNTFGWLERDSIGRTSGVSRASRSSRFSEIADAVEMKSALTYEQTLKLDNISKMITQLNEKLQIALIIPQILENPKILGKSLKGTKYEPALKLVKEYRDEKIKMRTPKPPEVNSSTNKIIDYFVENYEILKFLPDWVGDLDQNYQTLIKCLRLISHVARGRFSRSALEQMERELALQTLYNLNEEVIKDVNRIMFTTSAVKKTLHQHNIKRKELEEEEKKAESQFQKKLSKNLSREEDARAEKNKLVLQFEALIRRYDQVMFEKFTEELLLDEAIEKLQQELDDFQPEFNREEQIYIELVVKKEEEYQRLLEIRAEDFRRNCAARKIQIWLTVYLAKKETFYFVFS
uniref:Dynein regulatory complex protein 10 n=1 Tax=Glossina austeni TaxID=7395 RepID=A0A1A9VD27_GLOAU